LKPRNPKIVLFYSTYNVHSSHTAVEEQGFFFLSREMDSVYYLDAVAGGNYG
jgi:hypothetical protein